MRVKALKVTNFKGIRKLVLDDPDPYLIIFEGMNGSGKTSAVDAIWASIGGARANPDEPVRRGESRAEAVVDLGEYRVTRSWAGGKTWLKVTRADGTDAAKPQTLLDSLFGSWANDPLAFARSDPKEQAAVLRRLVPGLDDRLAALDAEARDAYDERSDVNRAVRVDEGALASLPPAEDIQGYPSEAPDTDALLKAYRDAIQAEAAHRGRVNEVAHAWAAVNRLKGELEESDHRIYDLEQRLAKEKKRYAEVNDFLHKARTHHDSVKAEVDGLAPPDVDGARAAIDRAKADARRAAVRAQHESLVERIADNRQHADYLTERLKTIEAEKSALLAEAAYPVPGLAVTGDDVRFRGVLLKEASTSEQIKVGLSVVAAMGYPVRVMAVRDGSLLDDAAMDEVGRWAREHDYQIVVEVVGTGHGGIVIEDGLVVSTPEPAAPAEPRNLGGESPVTPRDEVEVLAMRTKSDRKRALDEEAEATF